MNMEEERLSRTYEIAIVAARPEALAAVRAHCEAEGARGSETLVLAPTKLAYPIRHIESAWFGSAVIEALPDAVARLSGRLKLDADVLRFFIISAPREQKKPAVLHPVQDVRPAAPRIATQLSNEALEAKIEEILK